MYSVSTEDSVNLKATGVDRVLQNVANIMRTIKGEIPLLREFGVGQSLDKPINQIQGLYTKEILEQVGKYEPRAKIKKLEFSIEYEKISINAQVEVIRIE